MKKKKKAFIARSKRGKLGKVGKLVEKDEKRVKPISQEVGPSSRHPQRNLLKKKKKKSTLFISSLGCTPKLIWRN